MALPSVDRMFITSAWLESILYGINCVLFGTCVYILFNRRKKAHWITLAACTFHISIATAHSILTLFRSLQAFTNPAIVSVPDGSSLYLVKHTALFFAGGTLHLLNGFALNFLLIWRLYVVWHNCWILIVMLTLEAAHIATSVAAWVLLFQTSPVFLRRTTQFVDAGLSFDLAVTVLVTSGIAYRLWRAGRNVSDLTGGQNAYKAAIYTIIESGAIYTSSIIVVTGLVISGSLAGVVALNVNIQISTLAPLLLIARLGLGMTHGDSKQSETLSAAGPSFARPVQVNITEEISTYPIDAVNSSSKSTQRSAQSYHDSGVKKNG
ncbi:hypothetical protein K503DRAFT_772138 [Rhizopogon vinicolor AM-OR11-026]|uniref:Uncharacterized protein n=1 Tax=Rhizopogon vinicolor AM-OR11-026 TaxID=1314800 RepID=A0A1B7MW94_9AGAM|nr:hypothetical protein K503DRAFT_772138 [Rhizopogon vinicolor AM-OR11-026]